MKNQPYNSEKNTQESVTASPSETHISEKALSLIEHMQQNGDDEGLGLEVKDIEDAPNYEPVKASRGLNGFLQLDFDDALQAIAFLDALTETLQIGNLDDNPDSGEGIGNLSVLLSGQSLNDLQYVPAGIYSSPLEAFARSIRSLTDPRSIPESLDRMMAVAMEIEGISAEIPSAYNLQ